MYTLDILQIVRRHAEGRVLHDAFDSRMLTCLVSPFLVCLFPQLYTHSVSIDLSRLSSSRLCLSPVYIQTGLITREGLNQGRVPRTARKDMKKVGKGRCE